MVLLYCLREERGERQPRRSEYVKLFFFVSVEEAEGGVCADLLELVLLRCFIFARLGGLSVQLLCCELDLERLGLAIWSCSEAHSREDIRKASAYLQVEQALLEAAHDAGGVWEIRQGGFCKG